MNPAYGNFRRGARGKPKPNGTMNKLESSFSDALTQRVRDGELLWWKFDSLTMVLGKDCRYTPDFLAQRADGELVFYECKGFMEQKSAVKVKTAAEQFPFRLFVVKKRALKDGGGFEETEVSR